MARRKNQFIFAPDRKRERRIGFGKVFLLLLVLVVAFLVAGSFVATSQVRLEKITVRVDHLPDDLESYSILLLSDLHGEELGEHQSRIKKALGSQRYSCVVMTGDMTGPDGDTSALMDLLDLLTPDKPWYYIPGDMDPLILDDQAHGSLSAMAEWAERLQNRGVIMLDRPVSETRGKGTIWFIPEDLYTLDLAGMETVYSRQINEINENATDNSPDDAARYRVAEYQLERLEAIKQAKKAITTDDVQIVLTHVPLGKDYIKETISWSEKGEAFSLRYADLILAGHHMAGQWRLPWNQAVYDRDLGWFPKDELINGLDWLETIPQYITPGLGSVREYPIVPGRVFNAPSIALITLTKK